MRANQIENQFTRKTAPQDLLRTFQSLLGKVDPGDLMKIIERMSSLSRIGPHECNAIRKICKWSAESFTALMKVISLSEKYETMDVKPSGHQTRLARGDKLNMTNVLMKKLGKMDDKYFLSEHKRILDNEFSLQNVSHKTMFYCPRIQFNK